MAEDIYKLPDEEVLRKLRNKLVATIGTHGSRRGCTFTTAFEEFQNDWGENLYNYAVRLNFNNVMDLLDIMPESLRVDRSQHEQRIYAINNQELSHCFDLIDRTPVSRARRREGHEGRQNRVASCRGAFRQQPPPPNVPLRDILYVKRYNKPNGGFKSSPPPPPPPQLVPLKFSQNTSSGGGGFAAAAKTFSTFDMDSVSNSMITTTTTSISNPTYVRGEKEVSSSLFQQIWESYRCKDSGVAQIDPSDGCSGRKYFMLMKSSTEQMLTIKSSSSSSTSSSSSGSSFSQGYVSNETSQNLVQGSSTTTTKSNSTNSICLNKLSIVKTFVAKTNLIKRCAFRVEKSSMILLNKFSTLKEDSTWLQSPSVCIKNQMAKELLYPPKIEASLEDLLKLLEEFDGLHLTQLIQIFYERFRENLSAKKLTQLLGVSPKIKNMLVAFMNYKPKIFEFAPNETDPLIRCVRYKMEKPPMIFQKNMEEISPEKKIDKNIHKNADEKIFIDVEENGRISFLFKDSSNNENCFVVENNNNNEDEEEEDWKSANETVYFECNNEYKV